MRKPILMTFFNVTLGGISEHPNGADLMMTERDATHTARQDRKVVFLCGLLNLKNYKYKYKKLVCNSRSIQSMYCDIRLLSILYN